MSTIHPLDPTRHATMRYDAAAGGAARRIVTLGRSEIALTAADAPLCFAKDAATGRFDLVALVGLAAPANLFVTPAGLHATYQPRAAALSAFRLDRAGVSGLAVDEGDAAIGDRGVPLFAARDDIRAALEHLLGDVAAARALAEGYAARGLLRPLHLSLTLGDGREEELDGLYIVDEDALATLDDTSVVAMHRDDDLAPAAVMAASLAQVERLRQLHNARHAPPITSFRLAIGR